MKLLLRLASVAAAVAMLVHAAALAVPALLYSPAYPWWRHILFIAIDGTLALLLPRPPKWLVWPFAVLTLQVLYSHGLGGWQYWNETGRINWLDAISVIGVPVVLVLLIVARTWSRQA